MVSSINLGSATTTSNGQTSLTNISSGGLDVNSLINAATTALGQPATIDQTTITTNNNIVTALGTLQSQLTSLMSASESLSNVVDSNGNQSNDVFNSRQAFVTASSGTAGTYIGATADNGAAIANYNITVGALAQAEIQRTGVFTSQTASVTGPAGSSTPNMFSAGTFQISGGQVTNAVTIAGGDTFATGDITSSGTVGSAALDSTFGSGGIANIDITGSGDTALVGGLAGAAISGTQTGGTGTPVTLTLSINGSTYTSNAIAANSGGSSNQIAAGTVITFTNSTDGTSFQVRTGAATTIANNANLSSFAANVDADLSNITMSQSHSISAFDATAATGTTLNGLTTADVQLNSSEYNPNNGSMGTISNFQVTAETAAGANNASMQVTINGETYKATGLDGTQTGNITFTSTTSPSTFTLAIGTAGISLNLSTTTAAKQVQSDLNNVFGTGVNITLDQGDSLSTIASKINSATTGGISASVIQVSSTDFQLTLQSAETGVANAYVINDAADGTMANVPLTNVQSAGDASFTVNNLTITRPTNNINDVIPDVTFNLYQTTPAGPPATTLQVQVTNNGSGALTAINSFVTAYNNFKTFAAEQQQRNSNGTFTSAAVLGNDNVLNSMLTQIQSQLNDMVNGLSASSLNSLASIGITFGDQAATTGTGATPAVNNILDVDTNTLTSAISTNPQNVQNIFDLVFNSSSTDKLQPFGDTGSVSVNKFDVAINSSAPSGQQVTFSYLDSKGNPQTAYGNFTSDNGGGVITGQTGTPFAGLTLLYLGDGNDTITGNTLTQGIADGIFNILNNALASGGPIDAEIQSYNTQNTTLNSQITTINQQVATYRTQLLNQYAALNSAISQANSTLEFLNIQAGIQTGGNVSG